GLVGGGREMTYDAFFLGGRRNRTRSIRAVFEASCTATTKPCGTFFSCSSRTVRRRAAPLKLLSEVTRSRLNLFIWFFSSSSLRASAVVGAQATSLPST